MSFKVPICILAAIGLVLAACQPAPTAAPLATPILLNLQITPSLERLAPVLNDCARQQPNLGITLDERPASSFVENFPGLSLRWGAPVHLPDFTAQIGKEKWVMITHPDNPLDRLSLAQLQTIYNGLPKTWAALLPPQCKTCPPDSTSRPFIGQEIHPWAYPADEDLQVVFQTALGETIKTGSTFLAPDPSGMRQAVAADPAALGFLPESYLDSSVKVIQMNNISESIQNQPILVFAAAPPQGQIRQWLGCVQDKLK